MSRYDGLIIPRSYSEYINKTDAATLQQALQLSGVLSNAVAAGDNKAVKSGAVNTALGNYRNGNYALIENINYNFSGTCANGTAETTLGKIYLPIIKNLVAGDNIYMRLMANLSTSGANKASLKVGSMETNEALVYAPNTYLQTEGSPFYKTTDVTGQWIDVILKNNNTTGAGSSYIYGFTISLYKKI